MNGSPKVQSAARRVLETGCAEVVVPRPAGQEEPGEFERRVFPMRRSCLNCGTLFVAVGRFNRLCRRCGRKTPWPD